MLRSTLIVCVALIFLGGSPLAAQDHDHGAAGGEQLGRVAFPVSCAEEVQPDFERAVAMLHSFWFEQAQAAFEQVAASDPDCAMAHWGLAMTLLGNPMTRMSPSPERLQMAADAAERAESRAATATERERGYVDAVLALYRDHETLDHPTRMRRHEAAMRAVHERYPEDAEAAVFYARAVVANAPPEDLAFERQLLGAGIMEPLFLAQPDHPGLAHYLIHAYDAPPIAGQGLEAARRYAAIAPSAPHALHMPSHIFTRLGYWQESIDTNRRSADAQENPDTAVHPLDYMVYAYLQLGRDEEAERVVERTVQIPDQFYQGALGYNFTAMPARLALERGRWDEAAQLPVPAGAPPYVEAITRFARAVGAARSGGLEAARQEVAALASLRDTLESQNDAFWATIVEAQGLAASAWVARAAGDDAEAEGLARTAAELEETVEKHPVTPGPILPARELEGDLLLELGRPAEALAAYEKTLEREPRRARALYGAARSAEAAGDEATARTHYTSLVELLSPETAREELARARAFLAGALSAAPRGGQSPPTIFEATLGETNTSAPEISTAELRVVLADPGALVLDVRPHLEWATSHIPGALNVALKPGMPMSLYTSDITEIGRLADGDPTRAVVLYCNGPFCGKSKRVAADLVAAGWTRVGRYQLGIPVWRALGGVTVIEPDGARYVRGADRTAVWIDAREPDAFGATTLAGTRNIPRSKVLEGKDVGEIKAAKDDGRLPMEDHNARIIVFGDDAEQARAVAEAITREAFHNVAYFEGGYAALAALLGE